MAGRIETSEIANERDRFLSHASHELKTPLTSLKLHTQLARRAFDKGNSTETSFRQLIEQNEKQVNRINHIIEDLLDISRIQSERLYMDCEDVDLVLITRNAIAKARQARPVLTAEVQLESPDKVMGFWDARRMEQIVCALVQNAMHFGGGKDVEIQIKPDTQEVRLSVRDHGPGFSPLDFERAFDTIERGALREGSQGLGLSLYICKRIAEAHRGRLTALNAEGGGAQLTLILPYR